MHTRTHTYSHSTPNTIIQIDNKPGPILSSGSIDGVFGDCKISIALCVTNLAQHNKWYSVIIKALGFNSTNFAIIKKYVQISSAVWKMVAGILDGDDDEKNTPHMPVFGCTLAMFVYAHFCSISCLNLLSPNRKSHKSMQSVVQMRLHGY